MTRVLVDFDSTLTTFDEAMLAACNKRFGTSYAASDINDWDWLRTFPHAAYAWGAMCYRSPAWTLTVPPQPGAVETVREMIAAGFEPFVVSDREPEMARWIRDWLRRYRLDSVVVLTTDRTLYPKATVARDLGMRIAVEDAPHHALALGEAGLTFYLIDKPYNQVVEHERVIRVHGWGQIAEALLAAPAGAGR